MVGGARKNLPAEWRPESGPGPQKASTKPVEVLLTSCLKSQKWDGADEIIRGIGHSPTSRQAWVESAETPVPKPRPRT